MTALATPPLPRQGKAMPSEWTNAIERARDNAPFLARSLDRLPDLAGLLAAGDADSLFTVNKIQTRFYRADTSPVNHDPDNLIQTQDLEPWFEENSCL